MEAARVSNAFTGLLVLVILIACAALYARSRQPRQGCQEPWLPPALRGSELAYSERMFTSARHGLVARLDRAYRVNGVLHLVELKTRARCEASPSDVIELSVQRIVVQEATGEAVSLRAFVAIQPIGAKHLVSVPVVLLDEEMVMRLRTRLSEVRDGRGRPPSPACSTRACANCGHVVVCSKAFGDRGNVARRR